MQDAVSDSSFVEPPTTLGPDPEDPSKEVTLPDGALEAGCYIEGPQTPEQTALLHSWCVEWTEAGHGFCYVHPRGPDPGELKVPLAKAITRSVDCHGDEPQWMTEEMRVETRAEYED